MIKITMKYINLLILWQSPKEKAFLITKSSWLNEIIDEHTQPQN